MCYSVEPLKRQKTREALLTHGNAREKGQFWHDNCYRFGFAGVAGLGGRFGASLASAWVSVGRRPHAQRSTRFRPLRGFNVGSLFALESVQGFAHAQSEIK